MNEKEAHRNKSSGEASFRTKTARSQALRPEYRVKKRKDFLEIQSSRSKVRSNTLLFAIVRKGGENAAAEGAVSRLGITVTTKVHKRAVRRNLLKRRIREVFRKERRFLLDAADIVVIALEGSTELDYQAVRSEFRFAMRKAGLLAYRNK